MSLKLEGSTILITGASAGIGTEFARKLAPSAKALVLVARRADRLAELKKELEGRHPSLKIEAIPCDLTRIQDIDAMFARARQAVGEIDILVNNAGLGDIGLFAGASWSKLNQMIALNVTALTYLAHLVAGPMIRNKRGGILMVSSMSGYQTLPGFGVYSATKYYVRGLTETLRAEFAQYGITVTQLCPGPVATEFVEVAVEGKDLRVPDFLVLSAADCARAAIRGFVAGKPVVLPGWVSKLQFLLHQLSPTPVVRLFLRLLARRISRAA